MSALLVDMVFVVEMLIFKDLLKGWCWDVCFLSGYSDRDIELRDCWWWLVLVCWDVCFLSGYSDRVVSVGWLAGWLAPERDIELSERLLVVGGSQ